MYWINKKRSEVEAKYPVKLKSDEEIFITNKRETLNKNEHTFLELLKILNNSFHMSRVIERDCGRKNNMVFFDKNKKYVSKNLINPQVR